MVLFQLDPLKSMRALRLVSLGVLLSACGADTDGANTDAALDDGTEEQSLDTTGWNLTITPGATGLSNTRQTETVVLGLNGELDLKAQVFDENAQLRINTPSAPVVVQWTSSDDAVVSVDSFGRATGVSNGTATVTGSVVGGSLSRSVTVNVQFSDMTNLRLNPERVALNVGATRRFEVSASDASGAPTTVDCANGAIGDFDPNIISASYSGTLGEESTSVDGTKKGFTLFSLNCDGFNSSPVVVEVKSPVTIPPPNTSSSADFGVNPSLSIEGSQTTVSSYDRDNGNLMLTTFDGVWESEILNGNGNYGRHSVVASSPVDNGRLVCATEQTSQTAIRCWDEVDGGFWADDIAVPNAQNKPFDMVVDPSGAAFLLQGRDLWYAAPDALLSWTKQTLTISWEEGSLLAPSGWALALGPDGLPRVAFQSAAGLVYGAPVDGRPGNYVFEFEEITDDAAGGQDLQLAVGANNRPQVVYLKDGKLVYGVKTSQRWFTEVVDAVSVGAEIGFSTNGWGEPRVSYYDQQTTTLRYAWRTRRNVWRITQPIEGLNLGDASGLQIDDQNRAQIVYHNQGRGNVGYYVEPLWLDYSLPAASSTDALDNTGVDGVIFEDLDGDGIAAASDCDDLDPTVKPGAVESCNGIDDDCDGYIDNGFDNDNDGVTTCGGDCNDADGTVYPGHVELCDGGKDNDCDPSTLEAQDGDGDGITACGGDCDDSDSSTYPGAGEVCDGNDNNCNGQFDEGYDQDGDGVSICTGDCDDANEDAFPGATEVCDGFDNDCNGVTDEGFDSDGDGLTICAGDCDDQDPSVVEECLSGDLVVEQGLNFRYLFADSFTMGCVSGRDDIGSYSCYSDETPSRVVTLTQDFLLMESEITQQEFAAISGYYPPTLHSCADCPVANVTWDVAAWYANEISLDEGLPECYTCVGTPTFEDIDAVTCSEPADVYACTGYRLPTEAEWEFAARGGEDHLFSGSNTLGSVGWFFNNSGYGSPLGIWKVAHDVCTKTPNAWGLCDMSGNVGEWTNDRYADDYYTYGSDTDPLGASTGDDRVYRGGDYDGYATDARSAYRSVTAQSNRSSTIGFRLARTVP